MKKTLVIVALLLASVHAQAAIKVGVGRVPITPDTEPVWLAGYAARTTPATGMLHHVWAKAIVFEDANGKRAVIITADLVNVTPAMRDLINSRITAKHNIPPHQILYNASHTHSAPQPWPYSRGLETRTLEERQLLAAQNIRFIEQMQEATDLAIADLSPASLAYGYGHAAFAINRRRRTTAPVDHSVPVLRVTDPNGKTRAVIFNYACHNTTLTSGNLLINGDYAGFAMLNLEAQLPGTTALFLQGCCGDQNPDPRSTVPLAQAYGQELSDAVLKVLKSKMHPLEPSLQTGFELTQLNYQVQPLEYYFNETQHKDKYRRNRAAQVISTYNLTDGHTPLPYPIQCLRLGKALTLISMSGEVVVDYALRLKREFPNENLIVCGYSQYAGYIPTLRVLQEGGYEGGDYSIFSGAPGAFTTDIEDTIFSALYKTLAQVDVTPPTAPPLTDQTLRFVSPYDGTQHSYRLFLPPAHNGTTPLPLFVALHGTGGDCHKYFDHPVYADGIYIREAQKRNMAVVCPSEGDPIGKPTEWRGVGELNVFAVIEDVCQRYPIDRSRITLSGQSMGGTGTSYLCCRYPGYFAAGAPLASTYGHVTLAANLQHTPMFYVQGAKDWPVYAETGPIPLTQEMQRLGYNAQLWMVPDQDHNTMQVSTPRVLDWALEQRLAPTPRQIRHRTYLPIHGRAWWCEITKIANPGYFAEVNAAIAPNNQINLCLTNTAAITLRPPADLLDLTAPIKVVLQNQTIFEQPCGTNQEIRLTVNNDKWQSTLTPRYIRPPHLRDCQPLGKVVNPPDWNGTAECSLGSWLADAMRDVAGSDLAITTRGHARGIQPRAGRTIDFYDLISWLRPSDTSLALFKMRGADLLEIIEANILDKPSELRFLIQVSGFSYTFNRTLPQSQRVTATTINPEQEYSIVVNSSNLTRTDTMHLGTRYKNIPYQELEPNVISTAWRYTIKQGGKIDTPPDFGTRVIALPQ